MKLKELHLTDASRRRFLTHQQELRASQLQKLDRDISRKVHTHRHTCTHKYTRTSVSIFTAGFRLLYSFYQHF